MNTTLSPLSIDSRSTEWSPLGPYRYGDNISPIPTSAGGPIVGGPKPLDTPPISTHSSADSTTEPDPPNSAISPHNQFDRFPKQPNQLMPRPSNLNNGNPSPPTSIVRSSVGTIATTVMDERKYAAMEAALAEHHRALQRFLTPYLREMRSNPAGQNRARDKLLKLSASQFQELSTDVFDEMTRREDERRRGGPNSPGNPVPKYLLPRPNFHQKRNQARQKLSTLPPERFQYLAADVFFEQERRFPRFARSASRSDSADRNSPSRNGFPSRSVSRQTDGGREGYRPPASPFSGGPSPSQPSNDGSFGSSDVGKPLPKMYQSNVMVPNKGTMVEEDDGSSGRSMMGNAEREALEAEHRAQVEELERKLDHLMQQLQNRDRELDDARDASKATTNLQQEKREWEDLRINLEQKIKEAQDLNDSMQAELSRVRMQHADLQEDMRSRENNERAMEEELRTALEEAQRHGTSMEQTLRAQIDNHQRESKRKEDKLLAQIEEIKAQNPASRARGFDDPSAGEWKTRCENLERELDRQRRVADEVKRDMAGHLQEMRNLSQRGHEAVEREEQLMDRITQLEGEVAEWKARCAKAGNGDMNDRAAVGKDLSSSYAPFVTDRGAVKDVNLSHFQLSIDDLLKQARTADQRALEEGMKQVVVCVRNITADMDADIPASDDQQRSKLRSRLSQAANNLITATKAHGAASGLAPVALVDAAAGHLTSAVVDVVRTFKVRKVAEGDLAKPAPLRTKSSLSDLSQRGMHDRNVSVNSSGGYSVYSRYSERNSNSNVTSPNAGDTGAAKPSMGMLREDDEPQTDDLASLKSDLDDQNAILVRSIQPLVNAIRAGGPPSINATMIANHVAAIDSTVRQISTMVDVVAASGSTSKKDALTKHTRPVLDALQDTVYDLSRHTDRDREGLPRSAFRVARLTKELIWRVEKVGRGEMRLEDGVAAVEL